jgi:hypothetical protein
MQLLDSASTSRLSLLLRYDAITPNTDVSQSNHLFEGSVILDLTRNKRAQVALDYQETLGTVPTATIAPSKMFQLRFVTNF